MTDELSGVDVAPSLVKALECFGSKSEFARAIGAKRQIIWQWVNTLGHIPASWALVVSRETGGKVSIEAIVTDAHRRTRKGGGLGQKGG